MAAKRRLAAALLAALVLVAVTASLCIILHEADHDCIGEGCPTCAVIAVCRSALKTLSGGLAVFAATVPSVCFALFLITALGDVFHGETPVSLRVKLLD